MTEPVDELDLGSGGALMSPTDILHNALVDFTGCVGNALADICSFGLTMGDSYVPFDPDPDECEDGEDAICSQAWVRVMGVSPQANTPLGFGGQDCAQVLSMDLEVGVLRCVEIPEDGEAPSATEVLEYSLQALDDMNAIMCAALACDVWDEISVGSWNPTGPMGGQYGGIWTFTVTL